MRIKTIANKDGLTFGVSTMGNIEGLIMCLASVLNGFVLPNRIQIRFEGKFPAFGNFYLEQLSCLAKVKGVEWEMFIAPSEGVRVARDWHIENSPYTWLWMGDDDVIYDYRCLAYYKEALGKLITDTATLADVIYFAGTKVDVSNLRGYPDHTTKMYDTYQAAHTAPLNLLYSVNAIGPSIFPTGYLDTGNCIISITQCQTRDVRFRIFEDSDNAGGEDAIFAALCAKRHLLAYAVPSAQSWHLEKPKAVFNEFAARRELIKRSIQCLPAENPPAESQEI